MGKIPKTRNFLIGRKEILLLDGWGPENWDRAVGQRLRNREVGAYVARLPYGRVLGFSGRKTGCFREFGSQWCSQLVGGANRPSFFAAPYRFFGDRGSSVVPARW